MEQGQPPPPPPISRVCCMGNSIQYYNDMPRLLEALSNHMLSHNSCLRGGASLTALFEKGGAEMAEKFIRRDPHDSYGAPSVAALFSEAEYDFALISDHTQAPSKLCGDGTRDGANQTCTGWRAQSIETLVTSYAPLLRKGIKKGVVFLDTPAYRAPVKGSERLGSWTQFVLGQIEGYEAYAEVLQKELPPRISVKVAKVNLAYATIKEERPELWWDLFHEDNFHPSALGTYLMANCVYRAMFDAPPPMATRLAKSEALFVKARRMLPPKKTLHGDGPTALNPGRLPTPEECEYFHRVADRIHAGLASPPPWDGQL